jgi:hypothetical protein
MGDQSVNHDSASTPDPDPAPEPASSSPPEPAPRFDDDGLPLHRAATLDDVRGSAGSGRTIAVGCFVLVAAAIVVFWIVRGGILG